MTRIRMCDNPNSTSNLWDAHRLVREYVNIAWMLNFSAQFEDLPWDNQIRVRRVAAVICACLSMDAMNNKPYDVIGSVFSNDENKEVLDNSEICTSDVSSIKEMLSQMANESWRIEHLLKKFDIQTNREQLLSVLLRYRIATEELINTFSGVQEARTGAYIGINALQSLYHPVLERCNDKVDDLIVLLLGKLRQTFHPNVSYNRQNHPPAKTHLLTNSNLRISATQKHPENFSEFF